MQLCQKTDDDADRPNNQRRGDRDDGWDDPPRAVAWPFAGDDGLGSGWRAGRRESARVKWRSWQWRPRLILGRSSVFGRARWCVCGSLQRPTCRPAQPARAPIPIIGFLSHAARDDVVECRRNSRICDARSRRQRSQVRGNRSFVVIIRKRHPARKRFVQNTCQRIDVYGRGDVTLRKTLGRHIGPRSDRGADRREAGVVDRFGDAEIDQVSEIARCDDDVLRLDITMNQPFGVCRVEGRRDLGDYRDGSLRVERSPLDQAL